MTEQGATVGEVTLERNVTQNKLENSKTQLMEDTRWRKKRQVGYYGKYSLQ